MRLYKVWSHGDFGAEQSMALWTSRKADIPALKREIVEANSDASTSGEPMVETIEFEAKVDGIVAMLNRHASCG